jgi:hypothetical protein
MRGSYRVNYGEILQEIRYTQQKIEVLRIKDPESRLIPYLQGRLSLLPELQTKTRLLEDRAIALPMPDCSDTAEILQNELDNLKEQLKNQAEFADMRSMIEHPEDWIGLR